MHQSKTKKASKKPHVLRWIREQLGLTQFDIARMIGSSQPTIQSIELGRLKLSERFAYKLQARLGLDAKSLLANCWDNLPEPEEVRKAFRQAAGFADQSYADVLAIRNNLFRGYLLLRAIADELGWHGCKAAGFDMIFYKVQLDLLNAIGDKKLREQVYQKHIDECGNPIKNMSRIIADAREIQRAFKEWKIGESKTGN
jgi:transcriptional regulator with XRE-family HTH domain